MFNQIQFGKGGMVCFQLVLKRDGIEYDEMKLQPDTPMTLTMNQQAAIKTRLAATATYSGKLHYFKDTLVPYMIVNGQRTKLGEYRIVNSRRSTSQNHGAVYQLVCFDLCQRAKAHKPEQRVYFPEGMLYTTAIENLLKRAGITNYIVEKSPLTLPSAREEWPRGTDALCIINTLLMEINYHSLFMDLNGVVRAKPYQKAVAENVTIRYSSRQANHIVLPGIDIQVDAFEHPNLFFYVCENPDIKSALYAFAENNNPANIFSTVNQGRVFAKIKVQQKCTKNTAVVLV